ncbi:MULTISPECIES: hypothetical protein [Methylotuvimicrobium]|uniref:Lipoprotein n=2 Tax=Methylotuvimicrobium TaxID=2822410 RepID=G4SWI1_META2|nr:MULTISPECIES: hypothetical protein [Methylotuvimicrobium]QCW83317.1 hypothetical protein EQU24_14490 [Methylotuvimicrobium buryatense]CCE24194.1 conserved exported protein of unknown function [Methylotuvimicrobium alcaliphilum 20Z]
MKNIMLRAKVSRLLLLLGIAIVVLSGCSQTLVKDDTRMDEAGTIHCSGSEGADDSSIAVIPIPVLAFFMPHADLNEINADDYLSRCGDSDKLINRKVIVGRGACFPTALTRIISLGIWQWCPASVSWEADVRP